MTEINTDFKNTNYLDSDAFANFPDLLTVENLQSALGVGRTMAYRLINDDKIKHLRIGRLIKIPKCFVMDFVLESCYNKHVAAGNLSCHIKGGN